MKVILIKDIKKHGKSGDILDVKDGYGKFLINNKEAVLATSFSIDRLDRENKQKISEEEKTIKECNQLKNNLEKLILIFKVKTGANDKVFGSISQKQIAEELKLRGYNIDKKKIKLIETISSLGVHNVDIELHKKVTATIKLKLEK